MRIGLFVAYWPWFSPEEQIELARKADRVGLDSVWVAEAWGQDVVSVLAQPSPAARRASASSRRTVAVWLGIWSRCSR